MTIELRPTKPEDLGRIIEIESSPESRSFVMVRDREWHEWALENPAMDHLTVIDDGEEVGIVLLGDVDSEHHNLELRKIAVAAPGRGVGRRAIELALERCFEDHGAHRVWLDVKLYNDRARHVYEALGFVDEGVARECYLFEGRYESLRIMSMLEQEWRTRQTIHRMYELFNAREIEPLLQLMHEDVDWPNAWEGGRVAGAEAVSEYWRRQWGQIDPKVEPVAIGAIDEDGTVEVRVRQVINDLNGDLIGQGEVLHVYRFTDGLIERMDVVPLDDLSAR